MKSFISRISCRISVCKDLMIVYCTDSGPDGLCGRVGVGPQHVEGSLPDLGVGGDAAPLATAQRQQRHR